MHSDIETTSISRAIVASSSFVVLIFRSIVSLSVMVNIIVMSFMKVGRCFLS